MLNLFFPKVCEACNNVLKDNELLICINCRHQLPVTNFHFDDSETVKKIVYGRVKLENATALLHFSKKGIVQQILHNLKYRGHEQISGLLGKWLGGELSTIKAYEGIDVVIFDIQDVGIRFYTYISTLHYVMEACAENNISLIILDRPNPNGNYIDGPTMEKEHQSFLGMHPIPLVHGMTIGEYAQMINGEKWLVNGIQCDIEVIEMKDYGHSRNYNLPIRPSPNLPNDQSIKLYPSLGLFEGTNINAGRGTEFQFQRYGAPFLNPETMMFTYTPQANFGAKYPKHKGELCYGEDLSNAEVNDEMTLKWIIKAYENSTDKSLFFLTNGFTKHAGTTKLQKQIEAGMTEVAIKATWQKDLESFKKIRANYLIYQQN